MSEKGIGSLLTAAEAKRVSGVIADVEANTAGEIVVAVSPRSDRYDDLRAVVAVVAAIGCAWVVYWSFPTVPSSVIFGGQVVLWLGFWWLAGWGPLIRKLAPSVRLSHVVDAKAKRVFLEQGLTETRDRSGVLIFISELEHRVEILADCGIHARVGNEGWQKEVDLIVRSIASGRAVDGLCEAVRDIGEKLAEAFPPRPDDVNELSDHVLYVE